MIHLDKNENKIAIIGNGCAGAECIKALRENGYRGEIHVLTDSKWPVYNPMLTTYYAAGKINFDQLFPYGKGDEFYREYRVDIHPVSPVVTLDAESRQVANKAGFELNYEQCLIASGASPILPPIEGIGSHKVYVMRTVEDAIKLKGAIDKKPRKALVIGASMVGIKLVELFYKLGIKVCLADLADRIFPLTAHADCSRVIEDRLRKMGIKLRFGAGIKKVEDSPTGVTAYFDNSSEKEEAELLVMCIGVRTNTGFIDRTQVELKQGIIVDERMRTNVPGLYAAGDVSQGKNLLTGEKQVIGLWANARYQGRTAGRDMAGIGEVYPGSIPHNITHFLGMDFVGIGDICQYDRMEKLSDSRRFMQLFWRHGLLTGANFVDTYTEAGVVKNALIKGLLQDTPGNNNSLTLIQNLHINKILAEVEKNDR
jgi:NADPH-dependent 2,4-dienoyl-CoA reductase/sulfur reductase-like enzyme